MSDRPAVVYKYCDAQGVGILTNLRLRVSPPNRFNDPFEFAPRIDPNLSRGKAKRIAYGDRQMQLTYKAMKAEGRVANFKEFKKFIRDNKETVIQHIIDWFPEEAARKRKQHLETVSREFGLICLSAVRDNILMWSHYGRGHQGIVIGFNASHPLLASQPGLVEVEYKQERVEMKYPDVEQSRALKEQVRAIIRRKSPLWQYEQEWRQLRFLADCKSEEDPQDRDRKLYFIEIEPRLISEVIIGCRAANAVVEAIRTIRARADFRHVNFCAAGMHDTDFALEISPLP